MLINFELIKRTNTLLYRKKHNYDAEIVLSALNLVAIVS